MPNPRILLADDLKPQLLEMGICEVLIPLTNSPSVEVQGNSAAALGNLSSKGMSEFELNEGLNLTLIWNDSRRGLRALQCCLEPARWRSAYVSRPIPGQLRPDLPAYRSLGE